MKNKNISHRESHGKTDTDEFDAPGARGGETIAAEAVGTNLVVG